MKKFLSLLLALFMLSTILVGCYTKESSVQSSDSENNNEETALQSSDSSAYQNLLNVYEELMISESNGEDIFSTNQSQYTSVSQEVFESLQSITSKTANHSMGYAIKNINNDSTPELILIDANYTIFAIFTIIHNTVTVVDDFLYENNHICGIDAEGNIYKTGYTKGETGYSSVYKLSTTGELVGTTFGTEDSSDEIKYYLITSNEKNYIKKEKYEELSSSYSYVFSNLKETTKNSGLEIIFILKFDPK